MTDSTHAFAHLTIRQRLPKVVQNVLADHDYPLEITEALQNLETELVENEFVSPLNTNSPDGRAWFEAWQPYQGRRWWDMPWFLAETFFYRRLLQASGYFGWPLVAVQQRPPTPASRAATELWEGIDPFASRKQAELQNYTTWQLLSSALEQSSIDSAETLYYLLHYALWGNRADLSYTQVGPSTLTVQSEQANLLVDDGEAVIDYLANLPTSCHLAFICDNAGLELLMDLALIDFLLRFGWVSQLTMHVKAHPTFVSDTTPTDVYQTVMALAEQPNPAMKALAARLQSYGSRLQVKSDIFWNSHRFFWELPDALRAELAQTQLVIIKGDANYRRLLGDSLAWPAETPLAEAVPYFPAPFVALRTLKSDSIVGLAHGQAEELNQKDPTWRVNGKRGVIQMVIKNER